MTSVVTELPLFSDPYFEYTTPLEDENFVITFRWNERSMDWYLEVFKEDLTPVIKSMKLVSYYPVMADFAFKESGLSGYFTLVDSGDKVSNKLKLGPQSLSQYYRLFYTYVTEDE